MRLVILTKREIRFDDEMINGIRTLIVYYKIQEPFAEFFENETYNWVSKKMQKPDLVLGKCSS